MEATSTELAPPASATNVVAGAFSRYCLLFVTIVSGAVLMPYTLHHLGAPRYGLWMLVATMTGYLQLLDAGYGNGLVRHLVAADARGDVTRCNRLISTFFCVYSVIGAATAAIGALLAVFVVPRFPRLTAEDVYLARWIVSFIVLRIAIGFPLTVFGAVTFARQGFARNTVIGIGVVVATAVVTVTVLSLGYGLLPLVAATTAVNLLAYVAYAQTARKMFPQMRIDVRLFSRADWRDVTSFSLYLFVIDIAMQIGFNIDNVVIGATLGTAAVALYAVALRLTEYQRRACDQFSDLLFPYASSLHDRGERNILRTTALEGTRVAALLSVGAAVALIGFGRQLVALWMGPGFEAAIPALMALAAASAVMVAHAPLVNVLLATGHHRLTALVWLGEAAVNLLASIWLVRRYGLTGVAVGTLIPVLVGHICILLPAACRSIGVPIAVALREGFAPALVSAAPAFVLAMVLSPHLVPASLPTLAAAGLAVGVTYLIAAFSVGLTRGTRDHYVAQVRRFVVLWS